MAQTPFKAYAQHNTMTVTGRIFNAEIPKGQEFLAVTVISTLENEGQECTFTFNTTNGLKSLYEKGWLPKGRLVTVTGHIKNVSETYTKDGVTHLKTRPEIRLVGAQVLDGGLGPMPSSKAPTTAPRGVVVQTAPAAAVETLPV